MGSWDGDLRLAFTSVHFGYVTRNAASGATGGAGTFGLET